MSLTAQAFADLFTFARASTGTRYNASGLVESVASGTARFDHVPATGAAAGVLLEGQRTNLAINSGALHNYTVLSSPVVGTNAATAPDGTTTATRFEVASGQTGFSLRNVGGSALAGDNANSVFFKRVGSPTGFLGFMRADRSPGVLGVNLATLELVSTGTTGVTNPRARLIALPDGWYRLEIGYTSNSAVENRIMLASSAPGDAVLLWGAQAEQGTRNPSSYIPTAASQVTRAADVLSIAAAETADWYNASTGTLLLEFAACGAPGNTVYYAELTGGASTTGMAVLENSAGLVTFWARNGGTTQADLPTAAIAAPGLAQKVAFAFAANDFAVCLNAGTVQTDTSGTVPVADRINFGSTVSGTAQAGMLLRKAQFWPERRSNATLQEITA